jgi:hypothetical protein
MKIKTLIALSSIGLLFACSATKLDKSWADPSFKAVAAKPFTKVLVIAPIKDANTQRIAEDKIVSELYKGVTGIQSYVYLLPADTLKEALEAKLIKDGFDGVLFMHLKEVEKSTSYTPGTSYGGYYGGYGYRGYGGYGVGYYGGGYTEGHYNEDKTYFVETNIYSLGERKLMWAGTTSTLNPTSLDTSLDEIIYAVRTDLKKKGYLKKN